MKNLLILLFLSFSLALFFPTATYGQETWKILNFHSSLEIQSSGLLNVVETITVDFGKVEKHGIFRDIPYIYQNKNGSKSYLEISLKSASRDGVLDKFSESRASGNYSIKIGDEEKTLSGQHTYEIKYAVIGALVGYEAFDELYWNTTGNNWEVSIEKASANIQLPGEGTRQYSCYQGVLSSSEKCITSEISKTEYYFATNKSLNSGEGMTVALAYEKHLIPLLVGKAPKTVADDLFKPVNVAITVVVFIVGFLLIINLWLRKGRDFWFGRNYLLGTKPELIPAGTRESIVVEYTPPNNLRPAELAALLDEKAETEDVSATIVDLAIRGYLTIEEEEKKWIFGDRDYTLKRTNQKWEDLLGYEKELLIRLFGDKITVKLSELKSKFYKDLAVVKEKLYSNLADKKFFQEHPNRVRVKYSSFAFLLGVLGGGLVWLGFVIVNSLAVEIGLVLISLAVIFLIIAQFMPARTALGRQMFARAKGYKLFIDTAEKHRQKFFESRNLFNEVLPYAIVFGLTGKFAEAFKKMGLELQQPTWYHSSRAFNSLALGNSLNTFSKSLSSSIAASPSSSGSGGSGSTGGGFGGGGGRSW